MMQLLLFFVMPLFSALLAEVSRIFRGFFFVSSYIWQQEIVLCILSMLLHKVNKFQTNKAALSIF